MPMPLCEIHAPSARGPSKRVSPAAGSGTARFPSRAAAGGPRWCTEVTEPGAHVPVLLPEVLAALRPAAGTLFVDCTFGRGGHARALLERLGRGARVLAMDRDPAAVAAARSLAAVDSRVVAVHAPFSSLEETFRGVFGEAAADGVLFDLGVSSPQISDPRGFSFRHDSDLDMRMDPGEGISAAEWLHAASERELIDVLWRLGEEPHARRIARAIVESRARAPLRRTRDLAELVARVTGRAGRSRGRRASHPATATFRALRMEVNQELHQLERGLEQAARLLSSGGRLVAVSFHSLEDRMVKRFIRDHGRGPSLPRGLPLEAARLPAPAFRKPGRAIRPGRDELRRNPRARSASLRVGVKE